MPRQSEPHSPLQLLPQTWLADARGLCQDEQSPPQKTGEPPSPPQESEGRRPEERWAATQGLALGTLRGTFFDTGRLLAQLEIDVGTSPTACWRSFLGGTFKPHVCGHDFLLYSVSVHLCLRFSLSFRDLIHDLWWCAGREDVHDV